MAIAGSFVALTNQQPSLNATTSGRLGIAALIPLLLLFAAPKVSALEQYACPGITDLYNSPEATCAAWTELTRPGQESAGVWTYDRSQILIHESGLPQCEDIYLYFGGPQDGQIDCVLGKTTMCTEPLVWNETNQLCLFPVPEYTPTGADKDKNLACDANTKPAGNPCNPATGNKFQVETDIQAGRLRFQRHYNSLSDIYVGFGLGWTASYLSKLDLQGGTIVARRPNGRGIAIRGYRGVWTPPADVRMQLVQETNGDFTLTLPDQTVEQYDAAGLLRSISRLNGASELLSYDGQNRLDRVDANTGESLTFSYAANGRVASITDHTSRTWGYRYDANNNLEYVDNPDGTSRQYHYEDTNFPYLLTGITDERGIRDATYAYDAQGRATLTTHAGDAQRVTIAYNDTNNTRTVTNSLNQDSTYTTSVQLGVTLVTDIVGPGCSTCSGSNTSYAYDTANNNLLSKTENGITTQYDDYDAKGQYGYKIEALGTAQERRTDYSYDSRFFNKITSITEPSVNPAGSKVTSYTYDAFGNRTSETITGFAPDGQGGYAAVSRSTTWQYNGPLNQLSFIDGPRTDVNDYTHYYYYTNEAAQGHNRARLEKIKDANGVWIRSNIQYSATGKVLSESRPNDLTLTYTYYTGNDRLETLTESDGSSSRVTKWTYLATGEVQTITTGFGTPAATTLTFGYDDARRLTRITDGLGNYIEYTLDTEGNRQEEKTHDSGGALKKQLSQTFDIYNRLDTTAQANETQDQDFAPDGTLDKSTDGNNVITDYSYDALKRLTQVIQDQGGTDPATANATTVYGYDVQDRLTSVTDPVNGNTTYVYDDLGNLLSQSSPDTGTTTFAYDAAGNLTQKTDAKGQVFVYSYDALNRLTSIDTPSDEDDAIYTYDSCSNGSGRLCGVTVASATPDPIVTAYSYTAFGEVASHQGVAYGYDAAGRLSTVTYPSGAIVTYAYDGAGQISRVDLTRGGQTETLLSGLQYQPFGPLDSATFGNGLGLTRSFDTAYRPGALSVPGILQNGYGFDANGNLTLLTDGLDAANDHSFGYDALSRLGDATRSGGPVAGDPGSPGDPPGPLFAAQPALLATIQTMDNETGTPPSGHSQPWLTMAVRNLTSSSAQLALERAEAAPGSVGAPETVGVVAIAGGVGSFTASDGQSVGYEALVSADSIRGWNTCTNVSLSGSYGAAPLVVGSAARHDGGDGGWLRRCNQSASAIGLTYDEDTYKDTERNHTTEAASLLVFSRAFDAALTDHDGSTWHLEAGEVTLNDTGANPGFVSVSFQQTYATMPVVLLLPGNANPDPASLRIRNVTTSGFEISQVEPANQDGVAPAESVPYVVIEAGIHQLPDGTWLYADHLTLDQVQHGGGVSGAESWYSLTFPDKPAVPVPPTIAQPGSQQFVYDRNGNRTELTEDGTPTAYSYAANSNRASSIGTDSVTLDANGNITAIGSRSFVHTSTNRIAEVRDNSVSVATYRYNGLGQRVYKDVAGELTAFVYGTDGQLLGDYQSDGTAIREYLYLNGEAVAQINGPGATAEVIFLHNDHLGTPRRATDSNGIVVWSWDSDAFGAVAANDDADGNGTPVTVPLRFPGQYYDQETGLHYNYFRYYDPSTGRYITSDPVGLDGGLNTFAYVGGNPIGFTDPFGLLVFAPAAPAATEALVASGFINTIGGLFVLSSGFSGPTDIPSPVPDNVVPFPGSEITPPGQCGPNDGGPDDPCHTLKAILDKRWEELQRKWMSPSNPEYPELLKLMRAFNAAVDRYNEVCHVKDPDTFPKYERRFRSVDMRQIPKR